MLKKLIKTILILSFALSPYSYANCNISNRLQIDLTVDDIARYTLNNSRSVSKKIITSKGYDNYDEYSYSENSYSKAIIEIKKNHKNIGDKYANAIISRLDEKMLTIVKVLEKLTKRCGTEASNNAFKEYYEKNIVSAALSGENTLVERELIQLNLNAIVDAVK